MRLSRLLFGSVFITAALLSQQPPPQDAADAPDEPGRAVARISVLSGDASVKRGDSSDWLAAALNVPLLAGDSVSVAAGGAVEVQLDRANFARMAGDSEMRISELDNGRQQVQLAKGLVTWRVLRESNAQTEISTPFAAVRPGVNASVRVEVTPDGATRVTVRHGDADVYSSGGTQHLREGEALVVRGDNDTQMIGAPSQDQWDGWNDERDNYLQRAQSPRYVSQDMYGTEDLDNYGRWDYDASYGNVWVPTVDASWAPYRNGHWVFEPFYGWTWVDYSPWGWAPFHYGSWYQRAGFGWCWFPGRRYDRIWWRPALVGFVGFGGRGGGFGGGFGFGNVGWVPLAPYERFHPWYGRGGFNGVGNRTVVNNINITNVYRNSRVNGGVTAVSATDFARGNFRNHIAVDQTHLQQGGLVRGGMPFTPGSQATRFTDRAPSNASNSGPRGDFSSQRFYSRSPSAGSQSGSQLRNQGVARGFTSAPGNNVGPVNNAPRMTTNPNWQRFGSPQPDSSAGRQFGGRPQPQYSAPAQPSRGFYGGSAARQVQVAPPIVHQREAAPSYQAPTYQQRGGNFGSPSYRGNGGGSNSAPAPRAAPAPSYRSAPAQSAPRSSGGGGGGGGGGNSSNAPRAHR